MIITIVFCVGAIISSISCQTGLLTGKQDSVIDLISVAGYPNELHRVITQDGYMLKLHRILPRAEKYRRGPVLLMHGFLGTAADFLISGQFSLGFQLANEGYQVFLGNARGSKLSMKHKKFDPLSREFWRFSFDEIANFDLPAIFDYISFLTKQEKLFYIGHNQGCTALLALLASQPNFNERILQAHLLAPIAFMDNPHPILSLNAENFIESEKVLKNFNFPSMIDFTQAIVDNYCDARVGGGRYCVRLWEFLFGRNRVETEIDPKILLQVPAFVSPTASVREILHFLQIYKKGKFQSFENRRLNKVAKEYVLTNVKVPVYLYHGAEDMIVSRLDIERLKNILNPVLKLYKVIPNFNHYDLLLSRNAKSLLFDDLVKAMTNDGLDFVGFVRTVFSG